MREPQRKPVPKAQARGSADLSELITPEYIPAEVFLENMGFFTPSSKRIKGIYVKEKKVGEKMGAEHEKHKILALLPQDLGLLSKNLSMTDNVTGPCFLPSDDVR